MARLTVNLFRMQGINKKIAVPLVAVSMLAGGALAGFAPLASAQTTPNANASTTAQQRANWKMHIKSMMGKRKGLHGVAGAVTAVNGNTITVTAKNGKTYTIDATSATVEKIETISVGDIKVGDTIGVRGTVSGDNVTAKNIMDGLKTPPRQ